MPKHHTIGPSLKALRLAQALTQEDFVEVSGRTYVSQIERSVKTPTIDKIDALAEVLAVHPLTLLTLAYLSRQSTAQLDRLQQRVADELYELLG